MLPTLLCVCKRLRASELICPLPKEKLPSGSHPPDPQHLPKAHPATPDRHHPWILCWVLKVMLRKSCPNLTTGTSAHNSRGCDELGEVKQEGDAGICK